jgi:hypothetical protein
LLVGKQNNDDKMENMIITINWRQEAEEVEAEGMNGCKYCAGK